MATTRDNPLRRLLSASEVRKRCGRIRRGAREGETRWFRVDEPRIGECAALVADTCRANYPDLNIPYHSRWRHFDVQGTDLWAYYRGKHLHGLEPVAVTMTAIDFVFVSVLLDAGAGPVWRYRDPVTGDELSRSEGLAAASAELFFDRLAREEAGFGLRLDAVCLGELTLEELAACFQHGHENPLVGIDNRLQLLRNLGQALAADPDLSRPGDVYRLLDSRSGRVDAADVLGLILDRFGVIWPKGLVREGIHIGDAGFHSLVETEDSSSRIVPFHKLSQWLTYSLLEPLQWSGVHVTGLDALTGLPEYRNGGLLLDTGVLAPVDEALLSDTLDVSSEAVVEWRALTVALLDEIAVAVRGLLDKTDDELPLPSILQGGTWAAGRAIASRLRGDGSPPIKLAIDGSVF